MRSCTERRNSHANRLAGCDIPIVLTSAALDSSMACATRTRGARFSAMQHLADEGAYKTAFLRIPDMLHSGAGSVAYQAHFLEINT